MKQTIITLLISFVFIFAQPDTLWTKTYGGSSSDYASWVQQTSDGGYIVVGATWPDGSDYRDIWLIKTDSLGDTLWTNIYGGNLSDIGNWVVQANDGGYIITGYTYSFGSGSNDVWLIKVDSSGDTIWTKTYGGSEGDGARSVAQTADGGYIICGSTQSFGAGFGDVWLIKTDANGDTLWTKTYGGPMPDGWGSVVQTTDGGYILGAGTRSFGSGGYDIWLIKTNSLGDTLWTKTYGGINEDYAYEVVQTTDYGYFITGMTESFGAGSPNIPDVWLIKTDSLGDTLWTQTYGGNEHEAGFSGKQTTDGGYIITGSIYTQLGDIWLLKINSLGDTLWTLSYGGSDGDSPASVIQTNDDGYLIAGRTYSYGAGNLDAWLIRIASETGINESSYDKPNTKSLQVWTVPTIIRNEFSTVKFSLPRKGWTDLSIYDIAGAKVKTVNKGIFASGHHETKIDTDDLSSGVYFVVLRQRAERVSKKVLVMSK
jgi:hypothetical protein